MCRILSSKFIKLILGIFFLFLTPKLVIASEYIPRGYFVIDLKNKIEWMTCPVGMVWNKNTCSGVAKKYELKFLPDIINIANKQLEGSWRLPTRKELESLVCKDCKIPKIDSKIFPRTEPVPYWTGERNKFAKKHYWSVNFYTGNTYGRFYPYQSLAVRLVRDR